jgi:aspartate beta-hydroxylase
MGILVDGVARVGATVEPGGAAAPAAGAPAAFERIVSTGAPIRGRHQGDDQEGSGVWSEFMLFDGTSWLGERCERASALCEVLRASPEVAGTVTTADGQSVTPQGQVTIFRLRAGAHILPHVGVTNRRLVLQFPLHGIEGVRFRVADVWREYVTGRALVFDDSYEHEIVHGGEYDRYVLYATLHHPELGEPVL